MKITASKPTFQPITFPNATISFGSDFANNVHETKGYFDPRYFSSVVEGTSPIYIARGVFSREAMESAAISYVNSGSKSTYSVLPVIERIGEPFYLGDDNSYFKNAANSQKIVDDVYRKAGISNCSESLIEFIAEHMQSIPIEVRPFRHEGINSFSGILRSWGTRGSNTRGKSTELHEDRIQQRNYHGYEVQGAINSSLVSTCIYFSNGTGRGELTLYDMRPSLDYAKLERTKSSSKYGFSLPVVSKAKKIVIRPEEGDVISFNSSMFHEVDSSSNLRKETDVFANNRITSTFYSAVVYEDGKPVVLVWS